MRSYSKLISLTAAAALVSACTRDRSTTYSESTTGDDVTGTYFAADSGHNLGKNWCYSGALVLDSTHHFGSVIKMCGDDGSGPATENLKGSYHLRTRTLKVAGVGRVRRVYVVLDVDGGDRKSHTLRYRNGTLRFDEPWWMSEGLRALDIPDPVLKRVSSITSDSSATGADSSTAAASSTRAVILAPTVLQASPKKAAAKKSGAK
ncbi:MAG: hypothetical protein H0W63_07910 [Gemmatimonadaceae bacterium]|nr:hypothetical protein [Gemmatimonadaceae bacterium]